MENPKVKEHPIYNQKILTHTRCFLLIHYYTQQQITTNKNNNNNNHIKIPQNEERELVAL